MILKWDDGASGVPPMCFSMPVSQPSILSWHVVEARVGEHDLEDDGRHAPADVFSFRFFFHDGYTAEVYFSFLLVGHTHEDIDALFSVISRFFRQIPNHAIEGKTPQSFQAEMAAALAERFVAECDTMESVLNWDDYLQPHKHPGTSGIQHVDIDAEPEAGARAPHRFWIHRRERDGAVGMPRP